MEDINRLAARENSWVIPILEAIGLKSRPEQIHFCYNSTKGDTSYNDPKSKITDYQTFDKLYQTASQELENKYGYKSDKNIWYAIGNANIAHFLTASNIFTLRVEAYVWVFDNRFLSITKSIAETLHEILEPEKTLVIPPEMLHRPKGYDFSMRDYID